MMDIKDYSKSYAGHPSIHTHGHPKMVWREVKELLAYVQKLREETGAWAMIEPGVSQSHNQTTILMSEGKNKKPWFPVI
jgi:hypothetical protein